MRISKKSSTFAAGMVKNHIIVWVLAAVVLSACAAPKTPEEALRTVAEADSLWLSGRTYTDSVSLAQAYTDLYRQSNTYPDEFAHACYHYGRLLRTQDDPVSAMQAFINATRSSSTTDYHILGRIYSNMGDLCHMAEEFTLSYDLFEKSADCFLQNGDTLNYYYALNDMAFEMAEQGKKDETLTLLTQINKECLNPYVCNATIETKSRLYLQCGQYDSTLYYAKGLFIKDTTNSAVSLLIAQAYSFLNVKDSATRYANAVLSHTLKLYERTNALYILTNDDETRDKASIRKTAADRADSQKLIEIQRSKLAVAVQVLKQNREKKHDHLWRIYAMVIGLLFIMASCILLIRIRRKRKLLTLLQKERDEHINKQLEQFELTCLSLRKIESVKEKLSWNDYQQMCNIVDSNFAFITSKLQSAYLLSEKEIRLCVLVLIDGFTSKQMAQLLFYAESGIRNFKSNTAKKIGTNGKEMRGFLIKFAFG